MNTTQTNQRFTARIIRLAVLAIMIFGLYFAVSHEKSQTSERVSEQPVSHITPHLPQTPSTYPSTESTRQSLHPIAAGDQEAEFVRRPTQRTAPFYVAEKRWNPSKNTYDFYRVGMDGKEREIRVDARAYFLSENQADYPQPESACGPTALLNLYIWYTKFGLIQESVHQSNLTAYKQLKFTEIDQKILEIQRQTERRSTGTHTLEQVVAMDELLQAQSASPIRLHFEQKKPPLNTEDFTQLTRDYRAGLMAVLPMDPKSGQMMDAHSVLVTRADTTGRITIANWGHFSHGRLVQRSDGQWFVPNDPEQHSLLIQSLTTLIPFTPEPFNEKRSRPSPAP